MSEIPADVMKIAEEICRQCFESYEQRFRPGIIARAILAEREACAKIADAHSECERDCGDVIASAIRDRREK